MIFTIATAVTEYVSTAVKTNAQTGCAVTPEDGTFSLIQSGTDPQCYPYLHR